jgi:small GTP-binding protein
MNRRILLFGDHLSGKTSIISQYIDGKIDLTTLPTISDDISIVHIKCDGREYKQQLWDTAGHKNFRLLTRRCHRGGVTGVMMVYDRTDLQSFENISSIWIPYMGKYTSSCTGILVVGNKSDLEGEIQVTDDIVGKFKEKFKGKYRIDCINVSAKDGTNIDLIFETVIRRALEIDSRENCSGNSVVNYSTDNTDNTDNIDNTDNGRRSLCFL